MTTFQGVAVATQVFAYGIGTAVRRAVPEAVVTMDPPEQQAAAARDEPRTNVFLVQVERDPVLRTADLPMRGADGTFQNAPQVALDLRYLVSFFGPSAKAHLMLGAVEVAYHLQPYLDPAVIASAVADRPDLQGSGLEAQRPPVQVAPRAMSLEDLSRFWSGFFQTPYTLSVLYELSPLLLQTDVTVETGPPVQVVHAPVTITAPTAAGS